MLEKLINQSQQLIAQLNEQIDRQYQYVPHNVHSEGVFDGHPGVLITQEKSFVLGDACVDEDSTFMFVTLVLKHLFDILLKDAPFLTNKAYFPISQLPSVEGDTHAVLQKHFDVFSNLKPVNKYTLTVNTLCTNGAITRVSIWLEDTVLKHWVIRLLLKTGHKKVEGS